MPEIETREIGNREKVVLWESATDLDTDEINPDTLRTIQGMLIDALEEQVEAAEAAADWETFMLHLAPGVKFSSDDKTYMRISASVRAL